MARTNHWTKDCKANHLQCKACVKKEHVESVWRNTNVQNYQNVTGIIDGNSVQRLTLMERLNVLIVENLVICTEVVQNCIPKYIVMKPRHILKN